MDLQNFTIAAWVRWLGNDSYGHNIGGIFCNGYDYDHFALSAGAPLVRSFVNYPTSNNNEHAYETSLLTDNEFHFLIVDYNGNTRRIWIDGNLVDEMEFSETISYSTTEDCYIGVDFPGGHDAFNGDIDDVRIYNRALSEDEIQALYHEGGWTGK